MVEDDPDDVELTLRAIQKNMIANDVFVAKNGVEALDFLFGEREHIDKIRPLTPSLVLLDIILPNLDGFEVLRRMRGSERTRLIPVVILTSSREKLDLLKGYEPGANSYVRKPTDFGESLLTVQELGQYWLTLNEPVPSHRGK